MNRTKSVCAVGMAAALIAACSSSKAPATSSTSPPARATSAPQSSVAAPAGATSATSSASAGASVGLSGKWTGKYGGAFTGTFVLQWVQSTSKLVGTINLSTAPGPEAITGTIAGGRIQFGTVGSQAITYTGSVSGNSMSGQYKVAGGSGGSGMWSATRS